MKILGINHSNDAAAALVVDGRVIAASQEERFTRIKHDPAFPDKAIDFCLKMQGLKLGDLDAVAFFWNPGIHAEAPQRRLTNSVSPSFGISVRRAGAIDFNSLGEPVSSIEQTVNLASGRSLPIHYLTHHLCHAAAAFFTSPFEDAAILTADGYGERQSTTIYRGRGSGLDCWPRSISPFHRIVLRRAHRLSRLSRQQRRGEGHGPGFLRQGQRVRGQVAPLVSLTPRGFELDLSYFEYFHERPHRYSEKLVRLLSPPRAPESVVDRRHEDIAFALQTVTEEAMLHLARVARELTGCEESVRGWRRGA